MNLSTTLQFLLYIRYTFKMVFTTPYHINFLQDTIWNLTKIIFLQTLYTHNLQCFIDFDVFMCYAVTIHYFNSLYNIKFVLAFRNTNILLCSLQQLTDQRHKLNINTKYCYYRHQFVEPLQTTSLDQQNLIFSNTYALEDSRLVVCDTMSLGEWFPMCQQITVPRSSRIKQSQGDQPASPALAFLLDSRPLRMSAPPLSPNIKSHSAKDTSHHRRLESSALL